MRVLREVLRRILCRELFRDESEIELVWQVTRDAVFVAESGPEVIEGVQEVSPQAKANVPLVRWTVQGVESESQFL